MAATGEEKAELKEELQRVVKTILAKDDYGAEITLEALVILSRLAKLNVKKSVCLGIDYKTLLEKFKCPISGEIMGDPVILASGQTYDRPNIEEWLNKGNLTCPLSKQVLSHTIVIPNYLVRQLISHWCSDCGIAPLKVYPDIGGQTLSELNRMYLNSLLVKMSCSLSDQKEAAKELRKLTEKTPSHRAVFCEFTDAISRLLRPLSEGNVESDPELQEDLVTTVLNRSNHNDNKKLVAENLVVIQVLTESLKFGTIQTRINAAATIVTLSKNDSNKHIIGNSGAPAALLELLCEGPSLAMVKATSAMLNLCIVSENKAKFTEIGAVNVILQKIKEGVVVVDMLLKILELLSTHEKAVDELADTDILRGLLQTLRYSKSEGVKESCVAILYNVCLVDPTFMIMMKSEEKHILHKLAGTGTPRAQTMARAITAKMRRRLLTIHSGSELQLR